MCDGHDNGKGADATSGKLSLPLKWHIDGGKAYLARRIVSLLPRHLHYVEPYAGGLAVLLARDPADPSLWVAPSGPRSGVSEVVNDLDRGLTNFWQVLRDEALFPRFLRRVGATPFSEAEWNLARQAGAPDRVEAAARFFVLCRQSLAGRMRSFTGITRTRTRRGMSNDVSAWLTAAEGLPAVHGRLKRVLVLDARPALDVIRSQDGPDTFFYLDPPYLHETRTTTADYGHEMTAADHAALLTALAGLRGKFILSGYDSPPYEQARAANGWGRIDLDLPNNVAGGKEKRRMTESLWFNYAPGRSGTGPGLFGEEV